MQMGLQWLAAGASYKRSRNSKTLQLLQRGRRRRAIEIATGLDIELALSIVKLVRPLAFVLDRASKIGGLNDATDE